MLTLLLDETGRGIGRGDATAVPGYVLGTNEIEATPEQYADPTAWILKGKKLVPAQPLPVAPTRPVITYKADLYRRCTDAEADAIEIALAGAPVRQRRLFESAQYLDHSDPIFATMHEALVGMFGAERADVLLAAS